MNCNDIRLDEYIMGKLIQTDNAKKNFQGNLNPGEKHGSENLFSWKCSRMRRQAICEIREETIEQNGVTLKCFRKHLVKTLSRE